MNSTRSNIRGLKVPVIPTEIFGEETMLAARLCKKHGVPFVTIDSPHTSELHSMAAINVVSKECIPGHYEGKSVEEIMELMKESTDGLTIITQGGGEMLYAKKRRC